MKKPVPAVFSFGFATVEKYIGFVEWRKGMNQFYLFLIDVGIAYIAFWVNKVNLKSEKQERKST